MSYIVFFLCVFLSSLNLEANASSKYVTVRLDGQLGNQLFQVATAYAYALDYSLPLTIPDLVNKKDKDVPYNARNFFLGRIPSYELPSNPVISWREPNFNYSRIPRASKIMLMGYFSSEKYFKHRRKEILELFSPPEEMNEAILSKYPFLASDELVVGIQVRDYSREFPAGDYHHTMGRAYYEKAMSYFPEDAIFLVSSNNLRFARECTEGIRTNVFYLDGPDYIEEFYTLVLCKSFIISNSTFGWWASWLSTSLNKKVIAPKSWFSLPYNNNEMTKDLLPLEYTVIE